MAIDYSVPVLVVDDYKTVARIMQHLVRQAGFADVDEATDGEEALAKMRERKYGLVITDWHMVPTSGLELLQKAKADEALKDTPFLMVSAENAPENLAVATGAGAVGYVVKPFDSRTLKARIEGALRTA
jgi:two-component system chemotaxis response regulator CheY